MSTARRLETTVLPGHRVVLTVPDLPEGARLDVTVALIQRPPTRFDSALDFLESLQPGPHAFRTWEEYERRLQEERSSWGQ